MGIPDSLIDEVRSRADLVELVARHTPLKRSGRTFRGPCPLHGGEGPNFSVDPAKGFFKCFVCGEGGDVFSFPMKHLGMDFLEAVRYVAEEAGVHIPDPEEDRARAPDPNSHLYEANAFAAEWFRKRLWEDEGGSVARDYLERRGVSREAAERFGLGWAPEAWADLGDAARRQGISNDVLLSLGLVKESKKGGREPYDAFRGRLVFPIEDVGGRVVAFGGRILGEAEEHVPKYLNSPETPLYHKGSVLYGLAWSRGSIRREEAALVVEGYMDYVSLASQGVENVVAPLGTAMTQEQAELLARYTPRVVLLYDSDTAGLKATFRSADELLRSGVEVLVATLPEGEDPDSLVRAKGPKALRRYLEDAVDVLDRKIGILERKGFFGSISGTRRAIDSLLPSVRAASDEVLRSVYLTRIAEKTGVPRATLEQEIEAAPARDRRPSGAPERRQRGEGRRAQDFGAPPPAAQRASLGPERNLLLLFVRDEGYLERALEREVGPDAFRDPGYRLVFDTLLHHAGKRDAEGEWLKELPDDVVSAVQDLRESGEGGMMSEPERFFEDNLLALVARPFEERLEELERELLIAPPDKQMPLLLEKNELRLSMRERGILPRSRFFRGPGK